MPMYEVVVWRDLKSHHRRLIINYFDEVWCAVWCRGVVCALSAARCWAVET